MKKILTNIGNNKTTATTITTVLICYSRKNLLSKLDKAKFKIKNQRIPRQTINHKWT